MNNLKSVFWMIVVFLSVLILTTVFISCNKASGATLYVDDSGGQVYTKIQDAIENATMGDTVYVYNGTYNEQLTISKSINLTGESNQNTIIKGTGASESKGIYVTANSASINNLKIDNFYYGIYLDSSSSNTIMSNTIMNSYEGIHFSSSSNNTIMSNTIANCSNGIGFTGSHNYIASSNSTIISNTIANCSFFGICLSLSSYNITIISNTITNCSFDGINLHDGSNNNNIVSNTITDCSQHGIDLTSSNNNNIMSNTITNCCEGIYLDFSTNNSITSNILINSNIFVTGNNIVSNNTINDKPVLYYTNVDARNSPRILNNVYANEIILYNCSGFVIENTKIEYGSILLGNSSYINTIFNTIANCSSRGIYINGSNNNITSNTLTNCSTSGIYLDSSSNNTIVSNTITNCRKFGIHLSSNSNNNNITSNTLINSSIRMSDDNIVSNNTINGKPILYYDNIDTQSSPRILDNVSASEIILYNCSGFVIKNTKMECGGILLINSSYIKIISNTFTNCSSGIFLYSNSNNSIITSNTFTNCGYGIGFSSSDSNNITYNTITNCSIGIYLSYYYCTSNNITSNNIYGNEECGLYSFGGLGNTAINNWWGDATGPYNANTNPNGKGDNITDGIPFSPWATSPFDVVATNHAPTINSITANTTSVNISEQVKITVNAADQDSDLLTYTYSATAGTVTCSNSIATWTAPATSGNYTISVTVSDGNLTATASISIAVVNNTVQPPHVNHAPVITSITSNKTTAYTGERITITVNAADQDGDALAYQYFPSGGAITAVDSIGTWTLPSTAGNYTALVTVSDGNLTASDNITVFVVNNTIQPSANHAPIIIKITSDVATINAGEWVAITVNATDADGDKLIYSYSAATGEIAGKGSAIIWIAPATAGNYTINIIVSDGDLTAKGNLTITVFTAPTEKPLEESEGGFIPGFEFILLTALIVVFVTIRVKKKSRF